MEILWYAELKGPRPGKISDVGNYLQMGNLNVTKIFHFKLILMLLAKIMTPNVLSK